MSEEEHLMNLDHERRIAALEAASLDIRAQLHAHDQAILDLRGGLAQISIDVMRCIDAVTIGTLAVTKQSKQVDALVFAQARHAEQMLIQHRSLELIAANTQEVLVRLQPKVTL